METFSDLAPLGSYLVSGMLPITAEDLKAAGMEEEQLIEALQFALWRLEAVQHWDRDNIFTALKAIADAMDIKLKPFLAPFFIAIAGSSASISVMDSMNLLGADMSRARLRYAIELLGGVGKKKLKKMEKAYQQLN
jgi:glutamyl-tRNA synthetase